MKAKPKPNANPADNAMQQPTKEYGFLTTEKKRKRRSRTDLETAVADRNLGRRSIHASQLHSLATRQGVHGVERNVEAGGGVVNGQDVDGVAAVRELPAGAAGGRVPAPDGGGASDVGELGDLALRLPVVAGDEAVGAVGAGDGCQGTRAVVVAGVVGDCGERDGMLVMRWNEEMVESLRTRISRGGGSEEGELEEVGQLHLGGYGMEML